ncbi:hypothetical protein MRB53_028912 [Persea americana]|uniref:Uncharacterized protein n=1 Tax=Persea americana TaxID=3435 RepID=A0ACC2KHL1_PERAE|nr:hypothetical protein MRB53_028912 [Persea americana]
MIIYVVTGEGEIPLEVDLMETVLVVKQKLQLLLRVPVARQTLSIYDIELVDGFEMEFYGVNKNTRINLTIMPNNNKFQIVVKLLTREIDLEVEAMDTVVSLKDKIHSNIGVPIRQLILFYLGTELENQLRLSDYGIGLHSEILAILKPVPHSRMIPQPRRLSLVVQTSSSLNSASIPLEMNECDTVSDVRELLLEKNYLPRNDYFFIHKQRIMKDNQSLRSHGVKNGDSIRVFQGTVSKGE